MVVEIDHQPIPAPPHFFTNLYSVTFSNALTVPIVNTTATNKDKEIAENITNKYFVSVDMFIYIISLNDYKKYFKYLYKENNKIFRKLFFIGRNHYRHLLKSINYFFKLINYFKY